MDIHQKSNVNTPLRRKNCMSNKTIELVENLESDPVESDPVEIVENDDEGLGNVSETSEEALNKYEF